MEGKKVLILAHKPAYPKMDGGCIAISQILEGFLDIGCNVHFLGMETKKHLSKNTIKHSNLNYKTLPVNTGVYFWGALKNLFTKDSYFLSRFSQHIFEQEIISTLNKHSFDLVIFESLFASSYLEVVQNHSQAKTIYRSHNIEHQIWETQILEENNIFRKNYLKYQVIRLKKEELTFWKEVDSIVSISEKDSTYIRLHTKKELNTIGLYCNNIELKPKEQGSKIDFFHLGAMDWQPNQQAISWLLENVWTVFNRINPETEFHIAGRGMNGSLLKIKLPGLQNHKEVSDAVKFISSHKVMLVPLFSGSGIRVKIIEGMALGKCIICTSLATEGLTTSNLENILIANTKEEFIEQMQFCLNEPKRVAEIGEQAREFAIANFSKSAVSLQLKNLFR